MHGHRVGVQIGFMLLCVCVCVSDCRGCGCTIICCDHYGRN